MNREEKAISPGAQHLFNYHRNMGKEAGYAKGVRHGIWYGIFGLLAFLLVTGIIHG